MLRGVICEGMGGAGPRKANRNLEGVLSLNTVGGEGVIWMFQKQSGRLLREECKEN